MASATVLSTLLKTTWGAPWRQVVEDIFRTLPESLSTSRVHLLVLDRHRSTTAWAGSRPAPHSTPRTQEVESPSQAAWHEGWAHQIHPSLQRLLQSLAGKSAWPRLYCLPLMHGKSAAAILVLEERPALTVLRSLRRHLRLVATALDAALSAQLDRLELEGYRALSHLLDTGTPRNRRALAQALGRSLTELTHARMCLILARSDSSGPLAVIGSRGCPLKLSSSLLVWPQDEPWCSLLQGDGPVKVNSRKLEPPWPQVLGDAHVLMTPIRWKGWLRSLLILPADIHQNGDSRLMDPSRLASVGAQAGLLWQNAELIARLRRDEEVLQGLVRRAIQVQEEERRRMASDIHDGVTQRIIGVWYKLLHLEKLVGDAVPEAKPVVTAIKGQVDAALQEARAAIYNLRPLTLDDLGLIPSLHSLVADFRADSGVACDIEVEGERRLLPHVEVGIYRIAQEALRNVKKHAEATAARLRLHFGEDTVRLSVSDNGKGFMPRKRRGNGRLTSFGLESMAERAQMLGADLHVQSGPGQGTTVRVAVPVPVGEPA